MIILNPVGVQGSGSEYEKNNSHHPSIVPATIRYGLVLILRK